MRDVIAMLLTLLAVAALMAVTVALMPRDALPCEFGTRTDCPAPPPAAQYPD